ncbi:MAG TPA: hypothetical protein DEA26_02825 [Oceanospirillales bacterium]|nr:hypothetical protein [Oceanospirillaceae bacterium]HBS41588.1 hypothetical protein [Oceanospirillales bacterium]|tara:strand:- start:5364 stop:6497 length:1134 start_codon:yes stop_codon:yes gene_type:complete
MPSHPLLNDHTISLSATLAATIGLEEAVLLTVLNDAARLQSQPHARLAIDTLRRQLPFWDDATLRRLLRSLADKGLLFLHGAEFPQAAGLVYSFEQLSERTVSRAPESPSQAPANRPQPMPVQWKPSEESLQRLEQHGIPRSFSCAQLDAFALQGQEQGTNRNDWNSRFFRHVKKQWVFAQNDAGKLRERAERTAFNPVVAEPHPIPHDWEPSEDACQILKNAGIDPQFTSDAVAEFILYWAERGEVHKTWNSKFIQHVRQQWVRYTSAVEHSPIPARISDDWQPAGDCFDILQMAHIPEDFARQLVPEFVLYWRDSNQVHNSWNSRFLQYVKQQWARRLAQNTTQNTTGDRRGEQADQPGYATAQASVHRLRDTSW